MFHHQSLSENDYFNICYRLGIDPESDTKATKILDEILDLEKITTTTAILKERLQGKNCFVFGAGPSLLEALQEIQQRLDKKTLQNVRIIAADGAAKALIKKEIAIDLVVSDLDGSLSTLKELHQKGKTIIAVHAHGDNIERLIAVKSLLQKGKIIGTTQGNETNKIKNYGGFTDGDRAVYLAANIGAKQIILFGFDFGDIIGKFSKPENHQKDFPASTKKKTKLSIAKELLEKTVNYFPQLTIFNCTPKGEPLESIATINYEQLEDILIKKD
ncbi:DUF115 domain-containing protein [Candidatus Heimdallarchaeota archaeon]|nr:MAG: DUF115 domain-containing protein [Candidatus Heimdallarchaeota archaeon]